MAARPIVRPRSQIQRYTFLKRRRPVRCVHQDPEPVRLASAAAVVRHEVDVGKIALGRWSNFQGPNRNESLGERRPVQCIGKAPDPGRISRTDADVRYTTDLSRGSGRWVISKSTALEGASCGAWSILDDSF